VSFAKYHICPKIIDSSPRELRYSSACSRSHLPHSVFFSRHVLSGESPWRTLPFVSSWGGNEETVPATEAAKGGSLVLGLAITNLAPLEKALLVVRPETVVGWHRQGFRLFLDLDFPAKAIRASRSEPRNQGSDPKDWRQLIPGGVPQGFMKNS